MGWLICWLRGHRWVDGGVHGSWCGLPHHTQVCSRCQAEQLGELAL